MAVFWRIISSMEDEPIPQILLEAFDGERDAIAWTLALSPWMLREIGVWLSQPKSEASRKKRADHMAERLMLTMEAERELPLSLKNALHRAGAMPGWKSLTPMQRRMLLLAVYRPVGMEGRERQTARLVDAAVARMQK